jgi:exopolysaccharide production protein ExoZ
MTQGDWLLASGDGSYAIYLTHGLVIPVVYIAGKYAGLAGGPLLLATLVIGLIASALVGHLTYVCVEKPTLYWLRRRAHTASCRIPL